MLFNDFDPDLNAITAVLASAANLAGTLTLNANGSFVFTPNAGFSGTTSFTYRATDGALFSDVAPVTITVGAAPLGPVANNDTASTAYQTPVTIDVLANDTFAGNRNQVTVTLGPVTNGTATVNNQRNVVFTPANGVSGTASFGYTITAGGLTSASATVTVTVAEPPPPVVEQLVVTSATVTPRANGRYRYQVNGTTTVRVGNSITVEVLNSANAYVTLGTSNVNRNTGAWSVSSNNSTIVPSSIPPLVQVRSSNGTVVTQ